jgi:hypothetical protein
LYINIGEEGNKGKMKFTVVAYNDLQSNIREKIPLLKNIEMEPDINN